jgi:hypothetical protein
MVRSNPIFKNDVAEQCTRLFVIAAHDPPP